MVGKLIAAVVGLGVVGLTGPAFAGTLIEGVYFGSGNGAIDWTAQSTDFRTGLELGLGIVKRYQGVYSESASGVYTVPTGATTQPGKSGSIWGYAFSVYDIIGGLTGLTYSLTIKDVGTNNSVTFNPMAIGDNAVLNGDGTYTGVSNDPTSQSVAHAASLTGTGFQNAETLSYPFTDPNGGSFNEWVADTYTITLTASNGIAVAVTVNAVPEPVSMSILGVGLVGMAVTRQRAKKARG